MNHRGLCLVGLLGLVCWGDAGAQTHCDSVSGRLASAQGTIEVRRLGQERWLPVFQGDVLCPGDSLRVGRHSRAGVTLRNDTLLRIDQATTLTFPEIPDEPTLLELLKGALHFITRTPSRLEVETPFVNAAVEGTEFALRTDIDSTAVWVYEGQVRAANEHGSLRLTSGEAAIAAEGEVPRPSLTLDLRDAVNWALYYPPLLDPRALSAASERPALARATALYRVGDVPAALATLQSLPIAERDAHYFNLKTALLLSVGRAEQAKSAIAKARVRDPGSTASFAYEAIIALTQNRKDQALVLARQAVSAGPESAIAHTALSYVQQAKFDIEAARESATRAVELSPDDALARARLAELELAAGDRDTALSAAREAVERDPELAHTQTVLGFAYLARIDTEQARAAFDAAAKRDQADPLPHLGSGLALIREGDLEAGRKEIEIAASLDPSQSIVRSYLGKAYFEEKRSPLAAEQYAMAKALDPKDPTPWFYDAILKQIENRPVEALQDIQRSIELNDNRAVYRSRLLLDEDLAARSASQARIYRDLGFEQLALVEGWKSVNADPSNYGAHRLLADTYSTLPRHEIARVSELLQSQLLQPLNLTPIQPQLAASDLLILEGAGPSEPAFNEFNPLFARDRLGLQISGVGGSNNTLGEEITQFGLLGPFSYSFGQFHYETDGFRDNSDLKHDIHNAFAQVLLTRQTSLQLEVRQEETESGDVRLHFNPEDVSPSERRSIQERSVRMGAHHAPSPGHDIITSFIYIERDSTTSENEGGSGELRYLYRNDRTRAC